MKTVISLVVVTIASLAFTLVVLMASIIGIIAISVLLETWDFTWNTTFYTCINEQAIVNSIMKYWLRFISVIYIPAVVITRVNYTKEILKAFE